MSEKPTRVQEVETEIQSRRQCDRFISANERDDLARSLAREVDARDAVITELLAMLKPGEKPNCMDPKYNPAKRVSIYDMDCLSHQTQAQIYARALEIAGRTE